MAISHSKQVVLVPFLSLLIVLSVVSTRKTVINFVEKQNFFNSPNDILVVVNKRRPLPAGYAPSDLVTPNIPLRLADGTDEMKVRQITANALVTMIKASKLNGLNLMLASGYRSEITQKALHASYVTQKGEAAADTDSARAGFSEHQTGLAIDLGRTDHKCEVEICFADTLEGKWLNDNAYKYGFIIRYPPGKQSVTGYVYEPWHVRFVGIESAKNMRASNKTLEEFLGLPAAPKYINQ
ncbi:MAG: M15 family metallopeptidase [Candidatus Saccharibacteria bacterium]